MKYILLKIVIVLLLGFQLFDSNKSEIEKLYIEALNKRIDLLLSSGYKYIELNEMTSEIKHKISSNNVYKFLDNDELIQVALKERKSLNIYRMTHKEISQDTIDINFSHLKLSVKRKIHWDKGLKLKKAEYRLNCGGTNGYKPDFRFVKDWKTNNWKLLINKFVNEEK